MKNKKSRTILFTVILSILSICLLIPTVLGAPTTKDAESIVVFDALQYNVENNQKITEEEIINRLGEPQKKKIGTIKHLTKSIRYTRLLMKTENTVFTKASFNASHCMMSLHIRIKMIFWVCSTCLRMLTQP